MSYFTYESDDELEVTRAQLCAIIEFHQNMLAEALGKADKAREAITLVEADLHEVGLEIAERNRRFVRFAKDVIQNTKTSPLKEVACD